MAKDVLLVFDGDDTLWATEPLYDGARARIRSFLTHYGTDGERWDRVERRIDLDRVARHGYAWHRFPTSCVAAFFEVEQQAHPLRKMFSGAVIFAIALGVFLGRPRVMPFAEHMLADASRYAEIVLLTKGQRWVQRRRIRQSGLRRYFASVQIVTEKDQRIFELIARDYGISRRISVGNSVASDIAPALKAGFWGVRIDAPSWEHENRLHAEAVPPFAVCDTLRQVETTVRELGQVAQPARQSATMGS